jgi:hypothetical protein
MAAYQARHSPYPGHSAQLYSIHATKRVRPLWVILALLLVVEAWLWDHLEPIVARVVNFVPWRKLKIAVARWIEDLPPYAALGVFVVPFIVVLPVKFVGLCFIATGNWFGSITTLLLAKLFGLGVTAFVFDATRHKLLQIFVVPANVRLGHVGA